MKVCKCCGQKIRKKMKHNLTGGLVDTLIIFANKLKEQGKSELHMIDSGLSVTRTNNFQKLRYFQLVEKGSEKGFWKLTEYAIPFLKGEISARKYVVTFNNEVTRKSDERKNIRSVKTTEIYWQKEFNE